MFALFKKRDKTIEELYSAIINQSRQPKLYTDYNVPNKPIGRFQMITLHAAPHFCAFARNGDKKGAQRLFDIIFKDIELSFREIGVGDLGVPKKMKKYMQNFNAVIQAHAAANADHATITSRNVFGNETGMTKEFENYIINLFK